jgi:hypothetical protein
MNCIDLTKHKKMPHFIAIITEKGNQQGQVIGNTKSGSYKEMNKEQFEQAVKNNICFSFEIKEIKNEQEYTM